MDQKLKKIAEYLGCNEEELVNEMNKLIDGITEQHINIVIGILMMKLGSDISLAKKTELFDEIRKVVSTSK